MKHSIPLPAALLALAACAPGTRAADVCDAWPRSASEGSVPVSSPGTVTENFHGWLFTPVNCPRMSFPVTTEGMSEIDARRLADLVVHRSEASEQPRLQIEGLLFNDPNVIRLNITRFTTTETSVARPPENE